MHILYADDDKLSLGIVQRAFEARGHSVQSVYTGDATHLKNDLQTSLHDKPQPHFVILDGHNLTLDENGKPLVDIEPTLLIEWLYHSGIDGQTRFVLYSSDDSLLHQVQHNPKAGFWKAISKTGEHGGLRALLNLLEEMD